MDEARVELRKNESGPTEKEIAAYKPCRLVLIVLFIVCLAAMLIGAIIIIATAEKCVTAVPKSFSQDLKHGITYSVHVKNFLDSNGDGKGDLKGVISKLDYIKNLGVKSLSLDGVLNISDHKSLHSDIGSMDDFKELISKAKNMEIDVLLSFSPVYTSLQHPLFLKSSGNVSLYGGLYVWSTSSNLPYWLDKDGQSAWFPSNSESYYGYYGLEFPSLNYESSEVQDYMVSVLAFWLDKGIAGYELNGVSRLMTNVEIKENTGSKSYTQDLPKVHYLLSKWNTIAKEHSAVLIGDPQARVANISCYYGTAENPELDVIINSGFISKLTSNPFNVSLSEDLAAVEVFSSPAWSTKSSRGERLADAVTGSNVLAYGVMLATLPGMLLLGYGDEIGISSYNGDDIMRWDTSENAGFTTGLPYQSVNNKSVDLNVASLMEKNIKVFKALSEVRSTNAAFSGEGIKVLPTSGKTAAFVRYHDTNHLVVVVNPTAVTVSNINVYLSMLNAEKGTVLIDSNEMKRKDEPVNLKSLDVLPNQTLIIHVA